MKISEKGKDFIKLWEGCRLVTYDDGGGVLTIGYGHTGKDVVPGKQITMWEAIELFDKDIEFFAKGVHNLLEYHQNQNQFDALVSLAYNIGLGNFKISHVLTDINNGKEARQVAKGFLNWKTINGKFVKGLYDRRVSEKRIYEYGIYKNN